MENSYFTITTRIISNLVPIFGVIVTGGLFTVGYVLGRGSLISSKEEKGNLSLCRGFATMFDLFGIAAAYLGLFFYYSIFDTSFEQYLKIVGFGRYNLLFIAGGMYGGGWIENRVINFGIVIEITEKIVNDVKNNKIKEK